MQKILLRNQFWDRFWIFFLCTLHNTYITTDVILYLYHTCFNILWAPFLDIAHSSLILFNGFNLWSILEFIYPFCPRWISELFLNFFTVINKSITCKPWELTLLVPLLPSHLWWHHIYTVALYARYRSYHTDETQEHSESTCPG